MWLLKLNAGYIEILPFAVHGIKHREHWAISKALDGYGRRIDPSTPITAGTPRSNANCTCASWLSRGAKDMANTFLFSKYAPQLATCIMVGLVSKEPHMNKRTVCEHVY